MPGPLDDIPDANEGDSFGVGAINRIKQEAARAGNLDLGGGVWMQDSDANHSLPRRRGATETIPAIVYADVRCPDQYGNCGPNDTYEVTLGSQTVDVHRNEIAVRKAYVDSDGDYQAILNTPLIVARARHMYNADCLDECEPHLDQNDEIEIKLVKGDWYVWIPTFQYSTEECPE